MPKKPASKKAYKRKYRKTMKRKKKYKTKATYALAKSLILPDRQFCKLKYTELVSYSGSSQFSNVWRGNGPYDPRYAVGGGQPAGYDQLASVYTRYRVYGSKIIVSFIPDEASTQPYIGALVSTNSPTILTVPQFVQLPYVRPITVISQNARTKYYKSYMSTDKMAGEPKKKVQMDDVFSSLIGSVPSYEWFWIVTGQPTDGLTSITGHYQIVITYYCEFYKRADLLDA